MHVGWCRNCDPWGTDWEPMDPEPNNTTADQVHHHYFETHFIEFIASIT